MKIKSRLIIALILTITCSCTEKKNSTSVENIKSSFVEIKKTETKSKKAKDDISCINSEECLRQVRGDGAFIHTNKFGETYKHNHYLLSYSEEDEQAEWVCYELTKEECYGETERTNNFAEDPIIKTKSAKPYEYRNCGYDKGHLAPAGDMKHSQAAMNESFYMSNISPQKHEMNVGLWNDLENQCRRWAKNFKKIHIVTGPVLNIKNKKKLVYKDWGKDVSSNITIPEKYYKIIFDYAEPEIKMIAFLIPNSETLSSSFFDYAVPVDSIEKLTGIDFFSNMSKEMQQKYESSIDIEAWKKFSRTK